MKDPLGIIGTEFICSTGDPVMTISGYGDYGGIYGEVYKITWKDRRDGSYQESTSYATSEIKKFLDTNSWNAKGVRRNKIINEILDGKV